MARESKLKNQEEVPPKTVRDCLKTILSSSSYDEVGMDICRILYHSEDQPYDGWVQTWLIKCISECFKRKLIKMDIMFAYFALLPGYTLFEQVNVRLMRYVSDSGYLKKYPIKSKRSLEEIKNDPDESRKEKELKEIEEKIARMKGDCIDALVGYIEGITAKKEHIANLEKYGKLKNVNGKQIYCPYPVKLKVPRSIALPDTESKELDNTSKAATDKAAAKGDLQKLPAKNRSTQTLDNDLDIKKKRNKVGNIYLQIVMVLAVCFIFSRITWLIFVNTLAEKHGQFEAHASNCYLNLDFRLNDYNSPIIISGNNTYFNNEVPNTQSR